MPGERKSLAHYDGFVAAIHTLCADAGKRSALRSGLRRPVEQSPRMHAYVAERVPVNTFGALWELDRERAYYAVAAMMAAQPRGGQDAGRGTASTTTETADGASGMTPDDAEPVSTADGAAAQDGGAFAAVPLRDSAPRGRSLGETLGRAVRAGILNGQTTESRLHLMVRQSVDGIHQQLPAVVLQLRGNRPPVPIDWARLLDDLAWWGSHRDRIAKGWLQDYYRAVFAGDGHKRDADTPASPAA